MKSKQIKVKLEIRDCFGLNQFLNQLKSENKQNH